MRSSWVGVDVGEFVESVVVAGRLDLIFQPSELSGRLDPDEEPAGGSSAADRSQDIIPATGLGNPQHESLAARYAAKLAVLDLLDIRRSDEDARRVVLADSDAGPRVAEVPDRWDGDKADSGLAVPGQILISISHDSGMAVALAAIDY